MDYLNHLNQNSTMYKASTEHDIQITAHGIGSLALAAIMTVSMTYFPIYSTEEPPRLSDIALRASATILTGVLAGLIARTTYMHFARNSAKLINNQDVVNSDVVLVGTAKYDHNGAFSFQNSGQISKTLYNQDHTKIVERSISSIEELDTFLTQMKTQNNRIKGLIIRAHGSPDTCDLDNSECISTNVGRNIDKLHAPLQKLEKDATIILISCSTGKPIDGRLNMAGTIANLAPGRIVMAPKTIANINEVDFQWKDKKLHAVFKEGKIDITGIFHRRSLNMASMQVRFLSGKSDGLSSFFHIWPQVFK